MAKSSPASSNRGKKGAAPGTSRRKGRVAKLSRTASSLVSRAARAKGFAEAEVVTRWARIVGPELARTTVPIKLAFPRGERRGATLFVRAESAFAPLLQHRSAIVLELVNRYLGYGAVAKLEVRQGPLPVAQRRAELEKKPLAEGQKAALKDLVGEGDLSPLKAAVKSLGEYVLSDKGTKDS